MKTKLNKKNLSVFLGITLIAFISFGLMNAQKSEVKSEIVNRQVSMAQPDVASHAAKCGDGKMKENKKAKKEKNGKYGDGKAKDKKMSKCGDGKAKAKKASKCGTGKCGDGKAKDKKTSKKNKESKCGTGKCGKA